MSRRTLRDYIHSAFFARDKATLAQIVKDAEAEADPDDHAEPDGDEGKHASNVHVHIEHKGNGKEDNGDDDKKPPFAEDSGKLASRVAKLEDCMKSLDAKITKVLDAVSKDNTGTPLPPDDSGSDGDLADTTSEGVPSAAAELMEADPVPEGERMRMGDAAYAARRMQGLQHLLRDTVARAEVLAPGIKIPTWDNAPDGKQLGGQLCNLRRSTLLKVAETDDGKALLGNYAATLKTMSCDAVRFVFRDASERMRSVNNARNRPSPMFGDQQTNMRTYRTNQQAIIAGINKQNADYWASRANGRSN